MDSGKRRSRSMLELRHLRYFLALVEERNYGRAAKKLKIAQPGLSQQMQRLESVVGTALFDRTLRSVQLTAAGQLFAIGAAKALEQSERAVSDARRAGRGELGTLSIGYVASAAYVGALTSMISAFRKDYPEVELQISEMEMRAQLEAIAEGKLDICFIRPPVRLPPGIVSLPIMQETILLAIQEDHPLASLTAVPLDQLTDAVFITPHHSPAVSFHHHTLTACREAGFIPKMGPQGRDFMTIASMVSVGLGVALVPQSLRCIQLPGIVYRPVEGMTITAELSIASRRVEPSPVARAFMRHIRQANPPAVAGD